MPEELKDVPLVIDVAKAAAVASINTPKIEVKPIEPVFVPKPRTESHLTSELSTLRIRNNSRGGLKTTMRLTDDTIIVSQAGPAGVIFCPVAVDLTSINAMDDEFADRSALLLPKVSELGVGNSITPLSPDIILREIDDIMRRYSLVNRVSSGFVAIPIQNLDRAFDKMKDEAEIVNLIPPEMSGYLYGRIATVVFTTPKIVSFLTSILSHVALETSNRVNAHILPLLTILQEKFGAVTTEESLSTYSSELRMTATFMSHYRIIIGRPSTPHAIRSYAVKHYAEANARCTTLLRLIEARFSNTELTAPAGIDIDKLDDTFRWLEAADVVLKLLSDSMRLSSYRGELMSMLRTDSAKPGAWTIKARLDIHRPFISPVPMTIAGYPVNLLAVGDYVPWSKIPYVWDMDPRDGLEYVFEVSELLSHSYRDLQSHYLDVNAAKYSSTLAVKAPVEHSITQTTKDGIFFPLRLGALGRDAITLHMPLFGVFVKVKPTEFDYIKGNPIIPSVMRQSLVWEPRPLVDLSKLPFPLQ